MRADALPVSYSDLLARMERSRVTVTALIYGLLFNPKVVGAEIEMKVSPGDNITLICDLPLTRGSSISWIRNCSHENQPSLIIDHKIMYKYNLPRFSFLQNSKIHSLDLHITNITVSDLGLYNCAEYERKLIKDDNGITYTAEVYHYGNQTIRLSLAEQDTSCSGPSSTVSPPVSDCFLCWTLLFSVCPVCVLLCFICVYCLCHKKTTGGRTDHKENKRSRTTPQGDDEDDVCYASLDVTTRRPKRLKKQLQSSDFSTYAPVRTDTVQNF